jgi:hypothetical protein
MSSKVRFTPFEPALTDAYREFARRSWGGYAYQSKPAYLDWLYRENPAADPTKPQFLVAVNMHGEMVGAFHSMALLWDLAGDITTIPAAHNLYVKDEYRQGIGLYLVLAMMRRENHVFCPSQVPPLADTYRKLKWQEVPVHWYRRVLTPAATALRLLRNRTFGPRHDTVTAADLAPEPVTVRGGITVTHYPDDDAIEHIAAVLNRRLAQFRQKPHWTPAMVRWRFFHPLGPQHLLFHNGGEEFLILSLGQRHGITTSRIMEGSATSPDNLVPLVRQAERFLARNKVHVLLAVSGDAHINQALTAAGWRPEKRHSRKTFFYHRDRNAMFDGYAFNASAGDFGFEAIP